MFLITSSFVLIQFTLETDCCWWDSRHFPVPPTTRKTHKANTWMHFQQHSEAPRTMLSTLQPLLEPTPYINPIKCNEATVTAAVLECSPQPHPRLLSNIIIKAPVREKKNEKHSDIHAQPSSRGFTLPWKVKHKNINLSIPVKKKKKKESNS